MSKPNVLITFDSHTPYLAYRVSVLQREIVRRNLTGQVRLRVLLLGARDSTYDWQNESLEAEYGGVPVTILTEAFHGLGFRAYLSGLALKTCWRVGWNVIRTRPKVAFVGGYDRPASLLIAALGVIFRWKTGPLHDSRFNDSESYPKKVGLEAVKSPFMRLYHFFMCSGRECVEYTQFLAGVKRPAMHAGWNVVDNDGIAAKAEDSGDDDSLRATMGLRPDEPFLFMPIRFLPKKNISRVLEAYERALRGSSAAPLARLVIAGKGPLRDEVEEEIEARGLGKLIQLVEWIPYERIPRVARLSNAVILASTHDQWGLVINEALAAGAPVLVSNRCGAHELVQNNVNGFTFDPFDVDHLAKLITELSGNPELVHSLRANANPTMRRFSSTQFLDAWFSILERSGLVEK